MGSRNIRLVIAYDGTEFAGWQVQSNQRTVQGVIEAGLARLLDEPVRIRVAGRTDSGVHARGQVASFICDSSIPADRFRHAINTRIPRDVRVLSSDEVAGDFHARFSAVKRCYRYYVRRSEVSDPFSRRYALTVKRALDIRRLNAFASTLEGTHDFSTFAAAGDQSTSRVRNVSSAVFYREGQSVVFRIDANAFLWKMVRSIVGSILGFDAEGKEPGYMKDVLNARDRGLAGETAPAKGLFLHRVLYNE